MKFNETVKQLRKKCFLSQEDFAKELGVAFSTVNRWENGKTKPNLIAMKAIKSFCEGNGMDYKQIESEWLGCSEGINK